MIYAVIISLSLSGPVATFKSTDGFEDRDSCNRHIETETPRILQAAEHLAQTRGEMIRVRSFCVLIEQGVAA